MYSQQGDSSIAKDELQDCYMFFQSSFLVQGMHT